MSEVPANWKPPETPQTEEKLKRRRSLVPILIVMGCAFVMLLESVAGAFATCGFMQPGPHPLFTLFGYCIYFSVGVLVLSAAWLLLSLIIKAFQYWKDSGSQ